MSTRNVTMTLLTFAIVMMAALVFTTVPATAATVTHLGNYLNYGDGWRSTGDPDKDGGGGVANSDPNGDNAWGNDGYYVGSGKDTIASSLPAYITSVTRTGTGVDPNYSEFDNPALPIAPDVTPDLNATHYNQGAALVFTVTLAQDATFVTTVIFDNCNAAGYDVESITVDGPTASDATTGWTEDNIVDYAFFEVSGKAGDSFTVTCDSANHNNAMAGLGFEEVPEPGTLTLLAVGLLGLVQRRRRTA